jgi:hypothetical protein
MHTSLCLVFKSFVLFHFSCNKPQLHCTQLLQNYFIHDATTNSVCSSYYFVGVVDNDFLFFCYWFTRGWIYAGGLDLRSSIREGRKVGGIREDLLWSFSHWLVSEQQVREEFFDSEVLQHTLNILRCSTPLLPTSLPMAISTQQILPHQPTFDVCRCGFSASSHLLPYPNLWSGNLISDCLAKKHGKEPMNHRPLTTCKLCEPKN